VARTSRIRTLAVETVPTIPPHYSGNSAQPCKLHIFGGTAYGPVLGTGFGVATEQTFEIHTKRYLIGGA
jgi:hypothetical protein